MSSDLQMKLPTIVVIVMLTLTVESATSRIMKRLFYRALYKESETVALSTQMWKHTFHVPFRQHLYQGASTIPLRECTDPDRLALELCKALSEIIETFNDLALSMNGGVLSTYDTIRQIPVKNFQSHTLRL